MGHNIIEAWKTQVGLRHHVQHGGRPPESLRLLEHVNVEDYVEHVAGLPLVVLVGAQISHTKREAKRLARIL